MKLSKVTLTDDGRIPEIGVSMLQGDTYDLSFDSGIVTIVRKDKPDEEPFLVPLARVKCMRPATKAAKK